ncbi:MAG TPA: BatD family protein [Gemmatimonadales bacterium]|nr:BatD family protein [Gemmatimonadales bacterium]
MIAALLLAAAVQGGLEVTATVDRARVPVGGELTLTVRARSRAPGPVEIALPSIAGFAVTGSRDAAEVSSGNGGPFYATLRAVTLRAERVGQLVIGPVVARQGTERVQTDPVLVVVDSAPERRPTVLADAARALVDAVPPGGGPQPAVSVVASTDTALVGQQVDVVVVAWFPRPVRDRLRRPPLVSLPAAAGAWVLPQPVPAGAALSRRGPSGWMDAFVAHHVLLPLAAGRLVIPPAVVSYALPLSFSFFSREDRLTLTSDSLTIIVQALPADRAAGAAPTVVGTDVTVSARWSSADARVGEPVEVSTVVTGTGNVPLWSEPRIDWPAGFRAYAAGADERVELRAGQLRGTKVFRAVVVPDSSGSFVIPEIRYPYFDLSAGRYAVAVAPPRSVVVAPAGESRALRTAPPLARAAAPWTRLLTDGVPPVEWIVFALLPPVAALLARRRRARRGGSAAAVAPPPRPLTRLGRLEREFDALLASHVPDDGVRYGAGLGAALRAAGMDGAVADHVVRLRDRLRAARYGPRGVGDGAGIAAELERVLASLGHGEGRRRRVRRLAMVATARAATLAAGGAAAQSLTAEQLYEAGALRAAADSFAARAAAAPHVAAHWYNLGATLYRAAADGKAAAAWTAAARRAPRDPLIRRARQLLPPPDPASADLLRSGPLTTVEWLAAAGVAWVALWVVVALGRRRWPVVVLVLAVFTAAAAATVEWRRRVRPVAVVVHPATPVRAAPHGSATASTTLEAGAAVLAGRRYGRWVEVARSDGVRGWLLDADLVRP